MREPLPEPKADMAKVVRGRVRELGAPNSLGVKLIVILTAVGVAGAIGIATLLALVIMPGFGRMELRGIDAHVDRTHAVLGEYASKVESAVRDYGDWNDSYDYMIRPTRTFEQESFSPLAMSNLDVNGMAYVDNDRRIVIARWIDAADRDDPAMRARLIAAVARMDLARLVGERSSTSFYVRLGDAVAAMGVAKVRRSDGSGRPLGFVLMARQITSAQVSELLQLDSRIDLSTDVGETVRQNAARMLIAVPIDGADGRPVATARFSVPREVSLLGRRLLLLAIAGSVLLLLIVLILLRRMIGRQVLAPLARVERHMELVRQSGSLQLLADDGRRDEIGALGRSFNAMLSQLKDLREQIEAQSFALGRSESAVAVMHNVRNALSPISTIISQGIGRTPPVDRAILIRAADELARGDLSADRRQKLSRFVAAGVDALERARLDQVEQLGIGRDALAHVLEIIGQQQAAAHERPPLSECDVMELVAQNATIARYSGRGQIAFRYPAEPCPALANRVILSQVIGNLFANAAEAIAAAGRPSGEIAVSVERIDGKVVVRIADNGEGFDAEIGATLFQRGFSTRAHKSGGLGLHWCANSMAAMEGKLKLESEGRGHGASAVLTLRAPVAEATPVAA